MVEVSITSTTQSCSKVLKSCKCSCDPQNFRICDLHLCNTLRHFWNDFFNQKFSSGVHGCFHLDHLQTMLTSLTTPWAANWRVIRVSHGFDLTSPRKLPANGGRCFHPSSKKHRHKKLKNLKALFRARRTDIFPRWWAVEVLNTTWLEPTKSYIFIYSSNMANESYQLEKRRIIRANCCT